MAKKTSKRGARRAPTTNGKAPRRPAKSAAPKPSKPAKSAAPKQPKPAKGRRSELAQLAREARRPQVKATAGDPRRVKAEEEARKFAIESARMLSDDKCTDVIVMDVREKSQLSDFIVIASGTSDRQMRSGAEHLRDLARSLGHDVFRTNLDEQTTWIVLDCVDVVVHIFEPNQRAFYDLEMLWGDAPRIKWERAGRAAATAE